MKSITNNNEQSSFISQVERKVLLSSYPDLADINDPSWLNVIKSSRNLKATAGTIVMHGNAPMQHFMLLLSGTVRVFNPSKNGREITLYRVHSGDLCVLSLNSLYKNKQYGVFAEAETDIHALSISSSDFRLILNDSSKFRDFVLSTLNERLCDLMCLIQKTAFECLDKRLSELLLSLHCKCNTQKIKITHQDLARDLGTTREMISRILKEFEQQHLIKLSRGYIEIKSCEGLSTKHEVGVANM